MIHKVYYGSLRYVTNKYKKRLLHLNIILFFDHNEYYLLRVEFQSQVLSDTLIFSESLIPSESPIQSESPVLSIERLILRD